MSFKTQNEYKLKSPKYEIPDIKKSRVYQIKSNGHDETSRENKKLLSHDSTNICSFKVRTKDRENQLQLPIALKLTTVLIKIILRRKQKCEDKNGCLTWEIYFI